MSKCSRTLIAVGLSLVMGAPPRWVRFRPRRAERPSSSSTSRPRGCMAVPSRRTVSVLRTRSLGSSIPFGRREFRSSSSSTSLGAEAYSERLLAVAALLEVLEGDLVIEKTYQNDFIRTSHGDELRAMGITTLLITGFASHECVRSTVSGALAQGFEIVIIEDGHSGGESGYQATRQNETWRRMGLQVIPSAEIDFAARCAPPDPEGGSE